MSDTASRFVPPRLQGTRVGFEHLLLVTLGFVAATILLGVAAKATASGLACDANWPVCDGGLLNLFPETVPSFFEWIHRVVAMVAGLFIVGTAIVAFLQDSVGRTVTGAILAGTILTPIQVYLGRETVLSYEMLVLSLHFWTAIIIFVLFAAAAVAVWAETIGPRHVTGALLLGAITVPLHAVVSPIVIGTYTPVVQTIQYAVILALLSAVVLVATIGPRRFPQRHLRATFAAVVMLTVSLTVLGRQSVMTLSPTLDLAYLLVAVALTIACLGAAWATHGAPARRPA